MFDDFRFLLIVTEGSHDVEAISRILKIRGFQEIENKKMVPEDLRATIPKEYPFGNDGRMERVVPRPTFLVKLNQYIVVVNTGGVSKIGKGLANVLFVLNGKAHQALRGIAVITDMDNNTHSDRLSDLISQIEMELEDTGIDISSSREVVIKTEDEEYPIEFFFFPDNDSIGTLETLLLDGAALNYPEFLEYANDYIGKVKGRHCFRAFDDLKATVGAITNVLKPGRANQVSIHDNNWITEQTIQQLEKHKLFADFLDSFIKLLDNK